MKKVSAYQCDFCPKASTKAGAMAIHEKKCKHNPNNKHKCFDYCAQLEKVYMGHNRTGFQCKVTGDMMYSFHAENSSINITGLKRMPLQCEHHKYMSDEIVEQYFEETSKSDDTYFNDNIDEAKSDLDKACDLYRKYVGGAETEDERRRRINNFRSGGL